ncbi:MAG: hypothetical protein NC311_19415, partial [Muribaculaceae bacterium]|nr:hypothetical protein [Muribaculaceae bacterium]
MWKKVMAGILAVACLLPMGAVAAPMEEATLSAVDLEDGLAGYWTFDGATPLTNQAPGGVITASIDDAVATHTYVEEDGGISGGSAHFTGSGVSPLKLDLLDANMGLDPNDDDFTLSAWLKYESDMGVAYRSSLFQQRDDTGNNGRTILYVNTDWKYGTYLNAANVAVSGTASTANKWHHLVLTWDHTTSTMTCYINGQREIAATLTGTPWSGDTDIWIGSHRTDSRQTIKGDVDELRYYTRALSAAEAEELYEYNGYDAVADPPVPVNITVKPAQKVRDITPAMFGINHRYHKNGYGTWDTATQAVNQTFTDLVKDAAFGSIRWPGGTVSNLFTWKDSIGPLSGRTPTIPGNNFYSDAGETPVEPGFGLDEAARWICDDLGAEMIYVYGMGRGSAQDAADLVEYLNAPNDGSNPGGGTDWAAVRAANGHPEPYHVTKFEIGNEFTDVGQNYWATPRGTNADQAVEDYIMGGEMTFHGETSYYQHNERVVKEGDWRKEASFSDGTANQERYVCYTPVVEGSATVYVDVAGSTGSAANQWQIVDSLEGQGAANVCTFDYATGKITFGDGVNGNIPENGKKIFAYYSSERDGFAAYSDAMKAVAAQIPGLDIKIYSGVHDDLQDRFIEKMHQKGYDDKYDGVIYHPYTGTEYNEANYDDCLTQARAKAATVGARKTKMDDTTGTTDKEVAVSEFGINHSDEYTKALGNAIYTANHMIDCVNQGAAYQNRHCLVDFTVGDNLGAWTQAVIQCYGGENTVSANQYVVTPSAHLFSIFNNMTGNTQVAYEAAGNDNYHTGNGQTVQKTNIYTTKDDQGNIYVLIVNNQRDKAQEVTIAVNGVDDLTGRDIDIWTLTSESVMDQNTQAEPNKVTVDKTTATAQGAAFTCTLPAHSVSSVKIATDEVPPTHAITAQPTVANDRTVTVQPGENLTYQWYTATPAQVTSLDFGTSYDPATGLAASAEEASAVDPDAPAHGVTVTLDAEDGDLVIVTSEDIDLRSSVFKVAVGVGDANVSPNGVVTLFINGETTHMFGTAAYGPFTCAFQKLAPVSGQTAAQLTAADPGTYVCRITCPGGLVLTSAPVEVTSAENPPT